MAAISNITDETIKVGIQGSFSTLASTFFKSSLVHMIPWMEVMTAIVFCDLISALRRCYIMKEPISPTKATRDTMSKLVTYYSFVLSVSMLNTASGGEYEIDKWLCIAVCMIEIFSIISNILKPMGYHIDFIAFVNLIFGSVAKLLKWDKKDVSDVLKKDE